jgi:ADP-ribose pyrophosphatase
MARKNIRSKHKNHVIFEGRYLRLIKKEGWEFIERNNCTDIVIVVAMTKDHNVLFVEQYRPPIESKTIEFCAGLINDEGKKKETLLKGAKRELFEETGYEAGRLEVILKGPVSGGSSADLVTMVRAYDLVKKGKGGGDGTEGITVHEVPLKNVDGWLKRMEKKGYLIEPKIYSGLYFLRQYNRGS